MDRPRVLLIGPYYSLAGYYPQVAAFGRQVDLTALLPDLAGWPMFDADACDDPANRLDMRGLRLSAASAIPDDFPAEAQLCDLIAIPRSRTQSLMRGVTTWVRKTRPDVIVVTGKLWSNTFWRAHLARRLFAPRAKLVAVVKRNTYPPLPRFQDAVKRGIGRAGLRRASMVVTASDMASGMYQREFGASPAKLAVAPLAGVDAEGFTPAAERSTDGETLTVGYCGRLHPQKGVRLLVEAVEQARAQGHPLKLHVVGFGPQSRELRDLAASRSWFQVGDPVPMPELAPIMRTFDIYVLAATTSALHEEHDGHALLQAMATGLPCIGTRSGIIPEILRGDEGVVVPANDSGAISEAIVELARDPERRGELGAAAREAVQARYTFDAVARAHATIWRNIADETE